MLLLLGLLALSAPAQAANCSIATSQGTTGPANWQTYCWIDFSSLNVTSASSTGGQAFSLTLDDGTVLTFNLQFSGTSLTAVAAPSWSGAAIGNSAFLGIGGNPVLYQTGAGTTTVTISNIKLTPPGGVGVTQYMFIAADGESTNSGETLSFQTNGGAWQQMDVAGPISGASYPTTAGIGSTTFGETGNSAAVVGAYIVGSTTPTTLTTTLVGGGLQGAMFAVRFAAIRLTTQIKGARVVAADQFSFAIDATTNSAVLASGATSGTGLGPFTSAALSTSAAVPLTLAQAMASGSTDTISHYQSSLTCINATSGSSTVLPSGTLTVSYPLATLNFGDNIQCTFTETPYPHLTLSKALGATGREFATDQFTMNISQGATVVATTTTTGTGTTVTNGATAQTQVTSGSAYTLGEVGSGGTALSEYTAALACANANTSSTTTLPTASGGTITPVMGDVVSCTLTNTKVAANANLTVLKTSSVLSDPVNGTHNPKAIPGAIVTYTFLVTNTGPDAVTANSVFIVDTLPTQISVGTAANATFTQGSPTSGLTWSSGDIKFSNASTAPTSFAACTYTPVAAYDPAVRYVCLNPLGTFAGSTGTPPSFQLSIQAQVN